MTETERRHYDILHWNFPVQYQIEKGERKKLLEPLIKMYPQLLDPRYYKQLLDKSLIPSKHPLVYKTKEIRIPRQHFSKLVKQINSSGYWKMPCVLQCDAGDSFTDGYGFVLEANTRHKYNNVFRIGCQKDEPTFTRACQSLIDAAGLRKSIKLIGD